MILSHLKNKNSLVLMSGSGILLLLILLVVILRNKTSDLPSAPIKYGDFMIELTANGEVQAAQSINISAPRVNTNLQIVKIAPEGSVVKKGDFLLQFDTNELQKVIDDKQSELEIAQANLQKSKASLEANMARLNSALENAQASYELAKLRLDQMAFEADVKIQEEKLQLRQAEINLEQAKSNLEAQKLMDAAELTTLDLKVVQAKAELDKAREQLKQLTITAPAPGLVVYQKVWKGSTMEKIKVGDTPWRAQVLLTLPDLSQMQVNTEISEVEIGKLKNGQTVTIKLDAFPDPTFTGAVSDVASLAHEKEGTENVKVFDVIITINQTDPILKPGMTAKATILIAKFSNKYYVPIEAVFDQEGKKIVYVLEGKFKPVEVVLGERNDNFVVISGKVKAGLNVSLVDPHKPVETEKPQKQKEPFSLDKENLVTEKSL
jgi:RND family efflux transporter MFP subunit